MPEHELDENEDYTDEETGCNGSGALGAGSALAGAASCTLLYTRVSTPFAPSLSFPSL